MKFQPVIKWSGSKRSQSEDIINKFPTLINTYYEPFIGGGSIMLQLLYSNIKTNKYICSDINKDLINLWNTIKDNPIFLIESYKKMWNELNIDNDLNRKKQYFNFVRARFNKDRQTEDFLFLSRTATNGLIRYNLKGDFNSSLHITRNGTMPKTLEKILYQWSEKLNEFNVQFIHMDYSIIQTTKNDFIYLDPPYAGTKGMYYGTIDYDELWKWLKQQPCKYILSFDGTCGKIDRTYEVPKDIYNEHIYIESGNSSFKRLKCNTVEFVKESLYIKK